MFEPVDIPPEYIWIVVVGFIVAFVLAFGIGANDVANSFGTSVGSKVLTLYQACILATIFETLGAVLIGYRVSDTIRKGIIDVNTYNETESGHELLMMGNLSALGGSCIWLLVATLLGLPVSGTHSIVGATIGFSLVAHGTRGVNWGKFGTIVGSWFISPVMSGMVSTGIFFTCQYFILNKRNPLESGLKWLPVFYGCTLVINTFSVFYKGAPMLYLDRIPLWGVFILSFGVGILTALIVKFAITPWLRRRIKNKCQYMAPAGTTGNDKTKVKFTFTDNSASYSVANSRRNSYSGPGIKPQDIQIAIEQIEDKENEKNTAKRFVNGGNNEEIHAREKLLDISNFDRQNIGKFTVTAATQSKLEKPKMKKSPSAPLLDNEFNLGQSTPGQVTPGDITPRFGGGATPGDITPISPGAMTPRTPGTMTPRYDESGTVTPTRLESVYHTWHAGGNSGMATPTMGKPLLDVSGESPDVSKESFDATAEARAAIEDKPETAQLFSFLQILTAIFGAFAHGGNDVSNAIGPLISLWLISTSGALASKAQTPLWILLFGGVGISVGLWVWGRRVIKTIGEDLTKITPSSGFCIEIGAAATVLVASNIGIPISTTHCKVGSVVCVGRFRSRENVDWKVFRNIVLAWVVTVPVAGGLSAAMMAGLQHLVH